MKLPAGYHIDWAGEYESQKRSQKRLMIVLPLTILVICIILYTMFDSSQMGAADSRQCRHGAHRRLAGAADSRGTHFSVSSGVGFLALFGVAVQTGVIMLEYINQLRARGYSILEAAVEGSVLRLRPIMMTMLVASFGLTAGGAIAGHRLGFAAAVRHRDRGRSDRCTDAGRLLLPTLYTWFARPDDQLPAADVRTNRFRYRADGHRAIT